MPALFVQLPFSQFSFARPFRPTSVFPFQFCPPFSSNFRFPSSILPAIFVQLPFSQFNFARPFRPTSVSPVLSFLARITSRADTELKASYQSIPVFSTKNKANNNNKNNNNSNNNNINGRGRGVCTTHRERIISIVVFIIHSPFSSELRRGLNLNVQHDVDFYLPSLLDGLSLFNMYFFVVVFCFVFLFFFVFFRVLQQLFLEFKSNAWSCYCNGVYVYNYTYSHKCNFSDETAN